MADAATLKSYFETGDRPTAEQFAELIDSLHADVVTLGTFAEFIRDDPTIKQALVDLVTAIQAIKNDAHFATLKLTELPTSDPVDAGVVWNDNGTLKLSAG